MQLNLCNAGPNATDLLGRVLELLVGKNFWVTDTNDLCAELCKVDSVQYDSEGPELVLQLLGKGRAYEHVVVNVSTIEEMTAR